MLKLQFLTCKKYREEWSAVKNCNFSKIQFFQCTSTVIPLHIFAVGRISTQGAPCNLYRERVCSVVVSQIIVVNVQTEKFMWATTFSDYLGLKHVGKQKKLNFYPCFHAQALQSFSTYRTIQLSLMPPQLEISN